MSRIVFHIDVNSAFLSWSALERLEQNPDSVDLRTIPSAVAGDVASRHGVVTAASIPAKRCGVHSGQPVSCARSVCPGLVLVSANFAYYRRRSAAFLEILRRHSPAVEQFSIDEAFLDMSERFSDRRQNEAAIRACAAAIQTEIRETLGFTVNVGISENKLLAKMASDFEKPDKIHTLWPEELPEKLYPLPIRALFGVGGRSAEKLLRFGIHTIGEAAATPCDVLQRILGPSAGEAVYYSARGLSRSEVRRERPRAKSHSVEQTTAVDIDRANMRCELPPLLRELAEELSSRLKKANVRAETLAIIAKTTSFQRHTRQQRLDFPSNEAADLERFASQLFLALLEGEDGLFSKREALRLVGIGAARLEDPQYQQLSLFSLPSPSEVREAKQRAAAEAAETEKREAAEAAQAEKRRKLGEMQAAISARYGDKALLRGGALLSAERKELRNAQAEAKKQGQQSTEP